MGIREKLVELISCTPCVGYSSRTAVEHIADWLISNGVMAQECGGCEYCEEYKNLIELFINGKAAGRVFDTCIQIDENGLWHIEVPSGADIGIKFCPMCGRRLPQSTEGD